MKDMSTAVDDVRGDIDAMGEALVAISRIPTVARRRIAFRWLVERVNDDLRKLMVVEHEERVVALVGAVSGENE
jgi:hypothetical protein